MKVRMARWGSALAVLAFLVTAVGVAADGGSGAVAAARPISYLKVSGAVRGEIKGGVTRGGYENTIAVLGVEHDIASPSDGGQSTGRTSHRPLIITKDVDLSTPLLYAALTQSENLREVRIKFLGPLGPDGAEIQYLQILLTNARVESIVLDSGDGTSATPRERVSFVDQRIELTWIPQGIVEGANW